MSPTLLQFTCFILIVLAVEYLQLQNYQPHERYSGAWQQLELSLAWHGLQQHPQLMQEYEQQQQCCGYNNAEDYKTLQRPIPASCYQPAQPVQGEEIKLFPSGCQATLNRDKLFMWCIIGLEVSRCPSRAVHRTSFAFSL